MNIQPPEKRVLGETSLDVHSIFFTIQGEGPFCGTPCVFVRLAGCNLRCPACDTDYTSKRHPMLPGEILFEVNALWRRDRYRRGLVVVTGGEPFRQELAPLFDMLCSNGYYVQVETNGTLEPAQCAPGAGWTYNTRVQLDDRRGVYVVCSPKTPKLHPRIVDVACALKYVVRHDRVALDGLPTSALDMPNPPMRPPEDWDRLVYVQPLDSGNGVLNVLHTEAATRSASRHGHTLQLQIHKLIGVE